MKRLNINTTTEADYHNEFYSVVFFIMDNEIWFLADDKSSNLNLEGERIPAVKQIEES